MWGYVIFTAPKTRKVSLPVSSPNLEITLADGTRSHVERHIKQWPQIAEQMEYMDTYCSYTV